MAFAAGCCTLISFIIWFHPSNANKIANKLLACAIVIMAFAFVGVYINLSNLSSKYTLLVKCINNFQFLLAPLLYISIITFALPKPKLYVYWLWHSVPFLVYGLFEFIVFINESSIIQFKILDIGIEITPQELLSFQSVIYLVLSYFILIKHQKNIKLIASSTESINLKWLLHFLYFLVVILFFWLNDIFFGFSPLMKLMPFAYVASVFFLGYFSIKQQTVFAFKQNDLLAIDTLFKENPQDLELDIKIISEKIEPLENEHQNPSIHEEKEKTPPKTIKLSAQKIEMLTNKLNELIKAEMYTQNELSLPQLAAKMECSIHEASYIINHTTHQNFFTFINQHRIDKAKQLLISSKMQELNILGIAFEVGFNSKTAFNTAFKKFTGTSPSAFAKENAIK